MKTTRKIELRVKELSDLQELSDYDLASQARMNVQVIRRMFNNQQVQDLKISQLVRVAEVLQVPTGALFQDTTWQESGHNQ